MLGFFFAFILLAIVKILADKDSSFIRALVSALIIEAIVGPGGFFTGPVCARLHSAVLIVVIVAISRFVLTGAVVRFLCLPSQPFKKTLLVAGTYAIVTVAVLIGCSCLLGETLNEFLGGNPLSFLMNRGA